MYVCIYVCMYVYARVRVRSWLWLVLCDVVAVLLINEDAYEWWFLCLSLDSSLRVYDCRAWTLILLFVLLLCLSIAQCHSMSCYIFDCVCMCVYVLIHLFISPLRYVLIRSVNHLCFCFSFYLLQLLLLLTHSLTQHSICNAILFVCVLLMHSLSLSSLSLHRSLCFCAVIFPHHLSSILLLTYSINNPPPISLDKNIYLYISTYPQSNIYHPDSVNRARITAFSDHFKLLFLLIVNLIVYASPLCAPFLSFSFLPSFQVATKTTLLSEYATLYWAIPARCKESHFTIRNVSWLSVLCYVMCCVCVDWFFLSHHSLSLSSLCTPIHTRFHWKISISLSLHNTDCVYRSLVFEFDNIQFCLFFVFQ